MAYYKFEIRKKSKWRVVVHLSLILLFIYLFCLSCFGWDNDVRVEEHNQLTSHLLKEIGSEKHEKKIIEKKSRKDLKRNLRKTRKKGKEDEKSSDTTCG